MLPVSIVTGFLGSGKTTLLNRLLHHPGLRNAMVLINEFGKVGIDHLIVSAASEKVWLLDSGCMCCQVRGELSHTLAHIVRKRARRELPPFDRVLIETTGLADPVPIVHSIAAGAQLELDSVITVVDALHGASQLAEHEEARKQAAIADHLIVSKTDLADLAELPELCAALARINSAADIIPAPKGEVHPERVVGRRLPLEVLRAVPDGDGTHTHAIRSFTFTLATPVTAVGLATWLSMLASFKAAGLLRMKGIVNVAGSPYVVDVVQSVVHEPRELAKWPTEDERSRVVFIVRGIDRGSIARTLCAFAMGDSLPRTRQLDPDAYARFRKAARQFMD